MAKPVSYARLRRKPQLLNPRHSCAMAFPCTRVRRALSRCAEWAGFVPQSLLERVVKSTWKRVAAFLMLAYLPPL